MRDFSRILLLGSRATDEAPELLQERLQASAVHITADPAIGGAVLTVRVLATTLRRMPGGVSVDPRCLAPNVASALTDTGERIYPGRGIQLLQAPPQSAIRLHVGTQSRVADVIRIVPDGYGAHITRDADAIVRVARRAHPLGSIYAATLGAAEAFKDAARVRDERRVDHRHLTWCPVALSPDLEIAPMQNRTLSLNLALGGCGAVGTAIAVILQEMDAVGMILLIDRQRFAPENVATYSIGDVHNARGRPLKVNLVGRYLARYQVRRFAGDVEELAGLVDAGTIPWPRLVMAGFDSIRARHDLQRLWPDRLIDAGTADTALGIHDVMAEQGPCLMCFLPATTGESSVVDLADKTGLSLERLGRGDDPLLEEDIRHLDAERQDLLRPHLGTLVCGLANSLGLVGDGTGYQPAVPFIAQQAACLAVGRLLAVKLGKTSLPNFVQYDGLIGPRPDCLELRHPAPTCYCQARESIIHQVRTKRGQLRAHASSAGRF